MKYTVDTDKGTATLELEVCDDIEGVKWKARGSGQPCAKVIVDAKAGAGTDPLNNLAEFIHELSRDFSDLGY